MSRLAKAKVTVKVKVKVKVKTMIRNGFVLRPAGHTALGRVAGAGPG